MRENDRIIYLHKKHSYFHSDKGLAEIEFGFGLFNYLPFGVTSVRFLEAQYDWSGQRILNSFDTYLASHSFHTTQWPLFYL